MSNWKYATIRKGEHLQGRLHMQLHMNKKEKTVTVDVKRAQDINAEPCEEQKKGLNVHCRVQITHQCTNATDSARVYEVRSALPCTVSAPGSGQARDGLACAHMPSSLSHALHAETWLCSRFSQRRRSKTAGSSAVRRSILPRMRPASMRSVPGDLLILAGTAWLGFCVRRLRPAPAPPFLLAFAFTFRATHSHLHPSGARGSSQCGSTSRWSLTRSCVQTVRQAKVHVLLRSSIDVSFSFISPRAPGGGGAGGHINAHRLFEPDCPSTLQRVAPTGTGCIGCMSFALDGPNGIVNKKGQWPDQYWLLSQTEGLYTYEDVKKSVTFDSENSTLTHMVVSGRVRANLGVSPPPSSLPLLFTTA